MDMKYRVADVLFQLTGLLQRMASTGELLIQSFTLILQRALLSLF